MPYYSYKYLEELIQPAWILLVHEISIFSDNHLLKEPIEFNEDELDVQEDENHLYKRGYESDKEDEVYGLQGLVLELIDYANDLLKREEILNASVETLPMFLLCIKGYTLMPHEMVKL